MLIITTQLKIHCVVRFAMAAQEIFISGAVAQGAWGTKVLQWGLGAKPREGVCGTNQKLKRFAEVVYRF